MKHKRVRTHYACWYEQGQAQVEDFWASAVRIFQLQTWYICA